VRWGLETLAICTEPRRAFGPITGASMARADGITCVILNDVCAVTATPVLGGDGSATCSQSIIHSGGTSAENLSPQSTSSVCVLKVGFANQNAHASSNSRPRFGNPMGNSRKHGFAA